MMTIETAVQWATVIACSSGVFSMMCRINWMSKNTRPGVFYQHLILAVALFAVPIVMILARVSHDPNGTEYALLLLSAAVVAYIMIGAQRWRHGAPEGTLKR